MRIPKSVAVNFLVACSLAGIVINHARPDLWLGPLFLLICASAAWFAGNRFALLLSFFIGTVQYLNGNTLSSQLGPIVMAVQFCIALAVVLMLGVARSALEIEWRFGRIDPLTGALNRKAFFEIVENEGDQEGVTLVVFVDLDGLKQLNDRLGHEAGDQALQDFANRVREAVREGDIFARLGGDEFVLFLKVRDTASAGLVAQRLERHLNGGAARGATQLTCSLGALVLPAGSKSIDAEIKQADGLMYRAKRECVGLMLAHSGDANLHVLQPVAESAKSSGRQEAALRAAGQSFGRTPSRDPSQDFLVA